MNKKTKIGALVVLALVAPLTSFAALSNIRNLITDIRGIIDLIIPILFAIALIGFFYGLIKYIFGAEHDKEVAKKTMLWGVVALFVMSAVWGLVDFLGQAAGLQNNTAPSVGNLIPKN